MNYSLAIMLPNEENISFITKIANNIRLLSDNDKDVIDYILNKSFDINYLNYQIAELKNDRLDKNK